MSRGRLPLFTLLPRRILLGNLHSYTRIPVTDLGRRRPGLISELPRETVRIGVRVASEASILVVSSNEIELLGPVSAVFGASVRSLLGLFGQSRKSHSRKLIRHKESQG